MSEKTKYLIIFSVVVMLISFVTTVIEYYLYFSEYTVNTVKIFYLNLIPSLITIYLISIKIDSSDRTPKYLRIEYFQRFKYISTIYVLLNIIFIVLISLSVNYFVLSILNNFSAYLVIINPLLILLSIVTYIAFIFCLFNWSVIEMYISNKWIKFVSLFFLITHGSESFAIINAKDGNYTDIVPVDFTLLTPDGISNDKIELRRLNNEMYIGDVFYDTVGNVILYTNAYPDRKHTVDYYKINSIGIITDTFYTSSKLTEVGVFFEENGYCDWVISGNKVLRPYINIINGDNLSVHDFESIFLKSQQFNITVKYPDDYKKPKTVQIRYQTKKGWSLMTTKKRINDFDMADSFISDSYNYKKLKKTNLHDRIITLKNEDAPFKNWGDPSHRISLTYFKKQGHKSTSFMDINGVGWEGDYGDGYYTINHYGSKLKFIFFVSKLRGNYTTGITEYIVPKEYRSKFKTTLIHFKPLRTKNRANDTQGLFVLRDINIVNKDTIPVFEKQGIAFDNYLYEVMPHKWKLSFNGFDNINPAIISIKHLGKDVVLIDKNIRYKQIFNSLPIAFTIKWNIPGFDEGGIYYVHVGDYIYKWRSKESSIIADIKLNKIEIETIFQLLENEHDIVKLEVLYEPFEKSKGFLSLFLNNGKEKKRILRVNFHSTNRYYPPDENKMFHLEDEFEYGRIKLNADLAIKDNKYIDNFIEYNRKFLKYSDYNEGYSNYVTAHTGRLIWELINNKKYLLARSVFDIYYSEFYANSNKGYNSSITISLGFVTCSYLNDTGYCKKIIDTILPYYDLEDKNNKQLLYNIACYYSLSRQKERMLSVIPRLLEFGFDKVKILNDSDFSYYKKDKKFVSLLK